MAKRKISGRVRQRLNKQLQPWNDHVKELQHELNKTKPGTEFKEVLKLAKKTYRKKGQQGSNTIYSDSRIKVTKKIPRKSSLRASKKKKSGKRSRRRSFLGLF